MRTILPLAASILILSGCSWAPAIKAERSLAGRLIAIRNVGDHPFMVERIVANMSHGDANCSDRPARLLAPEEIYEVTFLVCGPVDNIEVETDEGVAFHEFLPDEPVA